MKRRGGEGSDIDALINELNNIINIPECIKDIEPSDKDFINQKLPKLIQNGKDPRNNKIINILNKLNKTEKTIKDFNTQIQTTIAKNADDLINKIYKKFEDNLELIIKGLNNRHCNIATSRQ
jgi:predicted transcriptional regulator